MRVSNEAHSCVLWLKILPMSGEGLVQGIVLQVGFRKKTACEEAFKQGSQPCSLTFEGLKMRERFRLGLTF